MNKYDVIGLMSGTSLDGLDIAAVRFEHDSLWSFNLLYSHSVPFPKELYDELGSSPNLSGLNLKKLDLKLGSWVGQEVKQFMDFNAFIPDLVVSHGHTVFHQPEIGLTHQIGDGYQIRVKSGIKTIADLRSLDVALGGQGAPLVSIGDQLLFGQYDYCLNLGGFSNISYDNDGERKAFDICPVNTVLNFLSAKLNLPYDKGGEIAMSGNVNINMLKALNSMDYYQQMPPKSLGIEWVAKNIFPLLRNESIPNLLRTYCEHITDQIVNTLDQDKNQIIETKNMLITGGGAKNNFLIDLLQNKLKGNVQITIPNTSIIDFKEAIIFAFLGLLKSLGKTNTLKSVTGANMDSSGGIIYE